MNPPMKAYRLLTRPTWDEFDEMTRLVKETTDVLNKTNTERNEAVRELSKARSDLNDAHDMLADYSRDNARLCEEIRTTKDRLSNAEDKLHDSNRVTTFPAADCEPSARADRLGYYTVVIEGKSWGAYPNQYLADKGLLVAQRMGLNAERTAFYHITTAGICPMCGKETRMAPNAQALTAFHGKSYHTACLAKWDATLQAAREATQEVKA